MQSSLVDLSGAALARGHGEVRVVTLVRVALALLIIGNLGRIPAFSTGERVAPILVNDLVLGAVIIGAALGVVARRSLVIDRVGLFALAFAGIGGLSALLSVPRFGLTAFELFASLAYLARWLFYFSIYVVVINFVGRADVEAVWAALERTILVFAGFGVLQSAFLPNFAQLVYPESRAVADWDPQGHRLVSTFLDPNFAGAFIVIGLVVLLARHSTGARVAPWKLVLLLAALVLTASRSSVLAFVVGLGMVFVIRGLSRRMLRALAMAAALSLVALPKLLEFARAYNKLTITDESALARLSSWFRGWMVFSDHPVIGIGINTWGFVQERYGWPRSFAATYAIEGGLLFVAVMTGLLGLALYVAMLWSVASRARRVWRNRRDDVPDGHRGIAIGAAAMIPAMLVHSLFSNSIFLPYLMEPLWVLWALVVCMDTMPSLRASRAPAADETPRRAPPRLVTPAPAR